MDGMPGNITSQDLTTTCTQQQVISFASCNQQEYSDRQTYDPAPFVQLPFKVTIAESTT